MKVERSNTLNAMFEHAVAEGQIDDFIDVLNAASNFRPSYADPSELDRIPSPIKLSTGPRTPKLIFVSAFVGKSGPYDYARLATMFRGERDVAAVFQPGFLSGEPIPEDLDAILKVHAENIKRYTDGAPFVLAGHSSGGLAAYRIAHHMESVGMDPAGVILLDTYATNMAIVEHIGPQILHNVVESQAKVQELSDEDIWGDAWLTAMGRYCKLNWFTDEPAACPTLLVRASDPGIEWTEDTDWRADWIHPHDVVDVPGTHWTMSRELVDTTSEAMKAWLAKLG